MADEHETCEVKLVRLVCEGHDVVEILANQIRPSSVSRVFQLDPATIWLREEYGNRAFLPNSSNTSFDLPDDAASVLQVMGSPLERQVSTPGTSFSMEGPYEAPQFALRKNKTCRIKVFQASLRRLSNGKCEFSIMGHIFIDVDESTANVNYIRSVVQRKCGAEYTLVSADGYEVENTERTQGFHFWRGLPLKYAVRNSDIPKIGIKRPLLAGNNPGPPRKAVSRNCPVCRFEHAFRGTTVLRGLEEFLESITPLLGSSDMPEPEDPEQDDSD